MVELNNRKLYLQISERTTRKTRPVIQLLSKGFYIKNTGCEHVIPLTHYKQSVRTKTESMLLLQTQHIHTHVLMYTNIVSS